MIYSPDHFAARTPESITQEEFEIMESVWPIAFHILNGLAMVDGNMTSKEWEMPLAIVVRELA